MSLNMKTELVTHRIKINGVRTSLTHSSTVKLPKNIVTELRAQNNKELKKLAKEVINL